MVYIISLNKEYCKSIYEILKDSHYCFQHYAMMWIIQEELMLLKFQV